MPIGGFDHVALPAGRPEEMLVFYRALGFTAPTPEAWRAEKGRMFAVHCGPNKINFHHPAFWQDPAFTLRGPAARPGCREGSLPGKGSSPSPTRTLKEKSEPVPNGGSM